MHATRRRFVGALFASAAGAAAAGAWARARPDRGGLKVLILGGTRFLGPALVRAAQAQGHSVTIFTRGLLEKIRGQEFDGVERLYGNRDPEKHADEQGGTGPRGLDQLRGRSWDIVLDTSGMIPEHVRASSRLLAGACGYYVFVSTMVAYASDREPGQDETAPVLGPADTSRWGDVVLKKAMCEPEVRAAFGDRCAILRPAYIIGPGDNTDRFNYWPLRVRRGRAGGPMLCPGTPMDPMQVIDVRDLAAFMLHVAQTRPQSDAGAMNVLGPARPYTWGDILDTCRTVSGSDVEFVWVDPEFLEQNGLVPGQIPIWMAPTGEFEGFHQRRNDRALAAGLRVRPMAETIRDILAWYGPEMAKRAEVARRASGDLKGVPLPPRMLGDPASPQSGLTAEREAAILKAWSEK